MFGWFSKRSPTSSPPVEEPRRSPALPVMREMPSPRPVANPPAPAKAPASPPPPPPPAPPEPSSSPAPVAPSPAPAQSDAAGPNALVAELIHPDPEIRVAAARELGRSGDPRAVGPLIDALRDTHPPVRIAAANGLGKLRDERAVDALAEVLLDEAGPAQAARIALRAISTARADAVLAEHEERAGKERRQDATAQATQAPPPPAELPLEPAPEAFASVPPPAARDAEAETASEAVPEVAQKAAQDAPDAAAASPTGLEELTPAQLGDQLLAVARAAMGGAAPPLDSYDTRRQRARALGQELHRRGGVDAMQRALDEHVDHLPGRHTIQQFWDGIGEWRG